MAPFASFFACMRCQENRYSEVSQKLQGVQAQSNAVDQKLNARTTAEHGVQAQAGAVDSECSATWTVDVQGDQTRIGTVDHERSARAVPVTVRSAGPELLTAEFMEMCFPRVSEETFKVGIEDFYTTLTVGLESLVRLAEVKDSIFLTGEFLQQSIYLLQSTDSVVRILVEKLAELRHPSSVEFRQALAEYNSVSGKIIDAWSALKLTTRFLRAYQSSKVEAAVASLETLVSVPAKSPRAVHVAEAKVAEGYIDACQAQMAQMQEQMKKLVESSSYGSLSHFVPNLNLTNSEYEFARWSGLGGVLFAVNTTASYICQLLLAAFAYAGDGPALIASTKVDSFNSGWASSLVTLHIHARKQFNKMKDSGRCPSIFMSRDNERLEYMLKDTKGHLESLLDQGKFLNMGAYTGSWQADRQKLLHNVPRLRHHFLLVQDRQSVHVGGLEFLTSNIVEGQRHLAQLSQLSPVAKVSGQALI